MASLAQYDIGQALKCLQKSESGTGKTTAALSFATADRQGYTFDVDQRMETAVAYYLKRKPEILKWNHYDRYYRWESIIEKLDQWCGGNKRCPYGVIQLDSITTIAKMIFNEQVDNREERAEASKNKPANERVRSMKLGDIPVSQIEDYKAENSGISMILSMLRSKAFEDTDIFVNAHVMTHYQKSIKDEAAGESPKPTRRIVTAGQAIAAEIPIYFNEIWHYYMDFGMNGKPRYQVMFKPTLEVKSEFNDFSRCAYDALPDSMDWTDKILGEEVRKLVPRKGSGF